MTKGIALGNHRTMSETRERIESQKKRLKYIIRLNKLKISSSSFRFYWEKSTDPSSSYPYYSYVDTPNKEYNWIFIQ